MIQHINDKSKPLIFVGTNLCLGKYIDVCQEVGIEIHGIIDGDYFGNVDNIEGIPVIDTEESFNDPSKLEYYKNFNFFCATNWSPETSAVASRNRDKRHRQINLLDEKELSVISLVDPLANVSYTSTIGRGCFIDAFALIEPHTVLQDYVNIYAFVGLGHHTRVDRNSVIQRHCSIAGCAHFEENCFLSVSVKALKTHAVFGKNTFIHECLYIRRGTIPNEVISINGSNMARVYSEEDRQVL